MGGSEARKISREEVRGFYSRFSEDELEGMRRRTANLCRRILDAEPSVKEVDDALFEMGRRVLENAGAQIEEEADGDSPVNNATARDLRARGNLFAWRRGS